MKKAIYLLFIFLPFVSNGQIITTFAGNGVSGYTGDGVAATATGLSIPYGVGLDSFGNFFLADAGNNRIRKIDAAGMITTIAGNGIAGYSGDGGPATAASLNYPIGMSVTRNGELYIVDYWNHRIRKINAESTGDIITICGTGTIGFSGDGGPATAAQIHRPQGIYIDIWNNIYFGDHYNHRVRKIDISGTITTIAGTGATAYSSDGVAATSSNLYYPSGVAVDPSGNVYIADYYHHRIRKVNTMGIISTIAGNGTIGYSGDGGPATAAQLKYPKDVAMDAIGNIYFSDADNFRIRKVDLSGTITTVAGNGTVGFSGDGGPAIAAQLNHPQGLYIDPNTNYIYIGDCLNDRVRVIKPITTDVNPIVDASYSVNIYPNPAHDELHIKIADQTSAVSIQLMNELGQVISEQKTVSGSVDLNLTDLPPAMYIIRLQCSGQTVYKKFFKN